MTTNFILVATAVSLLNSPVQPSTVECRAPLLIFDSLRWLQDPDRVINSLTKESRESAETDTSSQRVKVSTEEYIYKIRYCGESAVFAHQDQLIATVYQSMDPDRAIRIISELDALTRVYCSGWERHCVNRFHEILAPKRKDR